MSSLLVMQFPRATSLRILLSGIPFLVAVGLEGPAAAQESGPSDEDAPQYRLLRQEESWHRVSDRGNEGLHAHKYRPIGPEGTAFATIGGEVRTYARWYRNQDWGHGPAQDGYVLQRIMLHGALETPRESGEAYTRVFAQLKSGTVAGRKGPVYPTDKDLLGVNQAFLEMGMSPQSGRTALLRVGRQELHYGAGRMIAVREGPNMRLGYDALLGRYSSNRWRADLFVAKPTESSPGTLDNGWMPGRTLWGAHLRRRAPRLGMSVYYFGTDRAPSPQAPGRRATRHTIGGRGHGQLGPVGYDLEGAVQFGRQRSSSATESADTEETIRAWMLAGRLLYRLSSGAAQPTVGTLFDVSSGDARDTKSLGTFAAPYPSGRFTGAGSQLGPGNLLNLGPFVGFQFSSSLRLQLKGHIFWRLRDTDEIYAIWGAPLRSAPSTDARFVGTMPEMLLTWRAGAHTTAALEASHFRPGPLLKKTPPAKGLTHVGLRVTYRF